jgi:hypothetical protein
VELQESFGKRESICPAGTFHPGIYIDTVDIEELIDTLDPYIKIDDSKSEKIYSYGKIGLKEYSPAVKRPKGYILRGDSLEIQIENQRNLQTSNENREAIIPAGNCKKTTSIKCKISQCPEGTIEESTIEETMRVIRNFYNSIPNEKSKF